MLYFPELAPFRRRNLPAIDGVLAVGWIDANRPYRKGRASDNFVEKLWFFCSHPVFTWRGGYLCPICQKQAEFSLVEQRGEESLVLGMCEIRVFGTDGKIYAASDLIYHFVAKHEYLPPDEFIEAVTHGPAPTSDEYRTMIEKLGLSFVSPKRKLVIGPPGSGHARIEH